MLMSKVKSCVVKSAQLFCIYMRLIEENAIAFFKEPTVRNVRLSNPAHQSFELIITGF